MIWTNVKTHLYTKLSPPTAAADDDDNDDKGDDNTDENLESVTEMDKGIKNFFKPFHLIY